MVAKMAVLTAIRWVAEMGERWVDALADAKAGWRVDATADYSDAK